MSSAIKPNVFAYDDYRKFVGDWYRFNKDNSNFSFREFSARAGFKSANFIKLIIDGKRNVTADSIRKLIFAMKLSAEEGTFFKNLALLNQSKNGAERVSFARELGRSKMFQELHPLRGAALEFYQNWYSIPLREMIASPNFKEDPRWISDQFLGKVSAEQIKEALENMLVLGVVQRDGGGRLIQAQRIVSTGDEVESAAAAGFHRQMMTMAADSIDSVARRRRDISSVTITVSESSFQRVKEMVQNFRKAVLAEAESGLGPSSIYQLNFQLFPVTQELSEELPTEDKKKWLKSS